MQVLKVGDPALRMPQAERPGSTGSILCTVVSASPGSCTIDIPGIPGPTRAATALHLTLLHPGCHALALHDLATDTWFVHAAFHASAVEQEPSGPEAVPAVMQFDAETRTLRLDASRLQLNALDSIELACGTARLKITLQGSIQITADSITSSAVGSHRIEGASIDLN